MSNNKVQATFHPNTWVVYREDARFFVASTDSQGYITHTHPIPFDSQSEAERAAARLNRREW